MKLKVTKSLGMILLAVWLILTGVLTALSIGNPVIHVLLALLGVAAGILILLDR